MDKTYAVDILDWEKLMEHVERKEVTMREHPKFPYLVIFNYADIVAFKGLWTNETRLSRGLIVNIETNEVIARPFAKFFNYGQQGAPEIDLDTPIHHVGDKFDGSLGIVFRNPYTDELEVATRGSFSSEQALRATWMLDGWLGRQETYRFYIDEGLTPLVEIIYPENRIVVDYGDTEELADLGAVHNSSGAFIAPPREPMYDPVTLRDVLSRPSRANAEGWVVWLDHYTAVKIKYSAYIELHRIVTGLNRKSVWRALSEGHDKYLALLAQLPDELYAWAETVGNELNRSYALEMRAIDANYIVLTEMYENRGGSFEELDRALFASLVRDIQMPASYKSFMFSLLDGRDIQEKIWKSIEPAGGER